MTTTSSLSTETSPTPGSATAEVCASVDELKQRIFDATPMGLCLLIRAQPVLINARFAELLGAAPEDALRPAAWLPNCAGSSELPGMIVLIACL